MNITVIGDKMNQNYFKNNFSHTSNIEEMANQGIVFDNCYEINSNTSAVISSILSGKEMNSENGDSLINNGSLNNFIQIFYENEYQIILVGDWKENELKNINTSYFSKSNKIKILKNIDVDKKNQRININEKANTLRFYVDSLINYLKRKNDKKPFLIVFYQDISINENALTSPYEIRSLSHNTPGITNQHSMYVQTNIKNQFILTQKVDQNIGKLYNYLKSVNMFKNTVFVQTTMNGITQMKNDNFRKMFYSITFPEKFKPELKSSVLCQSSDCLPTLLDIVEINIPADVSGLSLLPVIKNSGITPTGWRDYVSVNSKGNNDHLATNYMGIMTNDYKLIHRCKVNKWELYNLKNDPRNQNNIFYFNQYENIKDSLIYLLENVKKQ